MFRKNCKKRIKQYRSIIRYSEIYPYVKGTVNSLFKGILVSYENARSSDTDNLDGYARYLEFISKIAEEIVAQADNQIEISGNLEQSEIRAVENLLDELHYFLNFSDKSVYAELSELFYAILTTTPQKLEFYEDELDRIPEELKIYDSFSELLRCFRLLRDNWKVMKEYITADVWKKFCFSYYYEFLYSNKVATCNLNGFVALATGQKKLVPIYVTSAVGYTLVDASSDIDKIEEHDSSDFEEVILFKNLKSQ